MSQVDSYLEDEETLFMTDDTISHLDCMILPKLHHIRVAAKVFKVSVGERQELTFVSHWSALKRWGCTRHLLHVTALTRKVAAPFDQPCLTFSFFSKDFEMPKELTYLWNYLGRAYHHEIFTSSCPTDQEIGFTWSQQVHSCIGTLHLTNTYISKNNPFLVDRKWAKYSFSHFWLEHWILCRSFLSKDIL